MGGSRELPARRELPVVRDTVRGEGGSSDTLGPPGRASNGPVVQDHEKQGREVSLGRSDDLRRRLVLKRVHDALNDMVVRAGDTRYLMTLQCVEGGGTIDVAGVERIDVAGLLQAAREACEAENMRPIEWIAYSSRCMIVLQWSKQWRPAPTMYEMVKRAGKAVRKALGMDAPAPKRRRTEAEDTLVARMARCQSRSETSRDVEHGVYEYTLSGNERVEQVAVHSPGVPYCLTGLQEACAEHGRNACAYIFPTKNAVVIQAEV